LSRPSAFTIAPGGPAEHQITRLDNFARMVPFGENQQVTFFAVAHHCRADLPPSQRTFPPPGTPRWRALSEEASVVFASDTAFVFSSSTTNLEFSHVQLYR